MQVFINQISNAGYYKTKHTVARKSVYPKNSDFQLSNFYTGQAILVRNNVSFKNLSHPTEITDKYNQEINDSSIDLRNIHIYRYPDTNLQLIINADHTIKTDDNKYIEQPQIIMSFANNIPKTERDCNKELILKEILSIELCKKSDDVICDIVNRKSTDFSFSEVFGQNIIDNLRNLNRTVSNLDINNENYKQAISNLNYEKEEFSIEDLKSYYDKWLNHASVSAYVTVSDKYFKDNKNKIFSNINNDIFKSVTIDDSQKADLKEMLIKELAISVVNANKIFNQNYFIRKDYIDAPLKIYCKQKFSKRDFDTKIDDIKNYNLEYITSIAKEDYKQDVSVTMQDIDGLALMKNSLIAKYGNNIFDLYKIINHISEQEIKDYIENLKVQEYQIKDYKELNRESF